MKSILASLAFLLSTQVAIAHNHTNTFNTDKTGVLKSIKRHLSETKHSGFTTKTSETCSLVLNSKKGSEEVSLITQSDEHKLQLLFNEDLSDINFKIQETETSIKITQDFSDSYITFDIKRNGDNNTVVTVDEYIPGEQRIRACVFEDRF